MNSLKILFSLHYAVYRIEFSLEFPTKRFIWYRRWIIFLELDYSCICWCVSHPLEIPSSLLPFKTIAILNNTRAAISSIELIEEDRRGKVRETLQNVWTSSLKLQNDYTWTKKCPRFDFFGNFQDQYKTFGACSTPCTRCWWMHSFLREVSFNQLFILELTFIMCVFCFSFSTIIIILLSSSVFTLKKICERTCLRFINGRESDTRSSFERGFEKFILLHRFLLFRRIWTQFLNQNDDFQANSSKTQIIHVYSR